MATGLSTATELRLRNQLGRVCRNSFGAEQGLRVLVMLATNQMLATGNSRASIRGTLTRLVREHPDANAGALRKTILQWSDEQNVPE